MRIASLTMASDSIAPCTNKVGWKKVSMAIDSGACDNVIDAEELLSGYKVYQTKASTSGMKYASATGEETPNLGQVTLPMFFFRGHEEEYEDASGSSIEAPRECDRMVIFDDSVSYLHTLSLLAYSIVYEVA